MMKMHFSCYKKYQTYLRFGLILNNVVKIRRKELVILQNALHITRKTSEPKMPTIRFYPKCENIERIIIRKSTASSYKRNSPLK